MTTDYTFDPKRRHLNESAIQDVAKLYLDEHLSTSAIAEKLRLTQSQVCDALKLIAAGLVTT